MKIAKRVILFIMICFIPFLFGCGTSEHNLNSIDAEEISSGLYVKSGNSFYFLRQAEMLPGAWEKGWEVYNQTSKYTHPDYSLNQPWYSLRYFGIGMTDEKEGSEKYYKATLKAGEELVVFSKSTIGDLLCIPAKTGYTVPLGFYGIYEEDAFEIETNGYSFYPMYIGEYYLNSYWEHDEIAAGFSRAFDGTWAPASHPFASVDDLAYEIQYAGVHVSENPTSRGIFIYDINGHVNTILTEKYEVTEDGDLTESSKNAIMDYVTQTGKETAVCPMFILDEFDSNPTYFEIPVISTWDATEGIPFFFDLNKNQDMSIGFYAGTHYHQIKMRASAKYHIPMEDDKTYLPINNTKDGYSIVDTSELEPGDYLIYAPDCGSLNSAYYAIEIIA